MTQENFRHFNKLKNRYWKFKNSLEISEVVRDFTNKINNIENKDLGPGDDFKITQAR